MSPDGAMRVLTSDDGQQWESAALITSADSDLRDAKITVTPRGELMLSGAAALHDKSVKTHQSLAWFSKDGRNWSTPHEIGDPNFWLWRVTWHRDKAYGIGYGCGGEKSVRLYTSDDGKTFETHVERLFDVGYPNETSLVFEGDTAYCLLRRDGTPGSGLLGVSQPPYTDWTWKDLGVKIGGPHMIRLPDGRYVAAVRLYDGAVRTSLCWLDPKAGELTEFLKLPSGGDTSYPGLVWHEGLLWVSYYSSHEGKTSIYLAKVQLPTTVCDIGSRRELFVDDYLIDRLQRATLVMHQPVPREVVIACDAPWEGNISAYYTLFADEDRFRMYYRGAHFDEKAKKATHPEFTCYAESSDGIHWEKPPLGLFEFQGSKENNIVWAGEDTHNFTPFKDANPNCAADARYKALGGSAIRWGGKGLRAYKSPDGIHWSIMQNQAVITVGDFDSQNLAFWHPERRMLRRLPPQVSRRCARHHDGNIRRLSELDRAGIPDFWQCPEGAPLHECDSAVLPRAHLFLGFPTRFQPHINRSNRS